MRVRANSFLLWNRVSKLIVADSSVVLVCERCYANLIENDIDEFITTGSIDEERYSKLNWYNKLRTMIFIPIISSAVEMLLSAGYFMSDLNRADNSLELIFTKIAEQQ